MREEMCSVVHSISPSTSSSTPPLSHFSKTNIFISSKKCHSSLPFCRSFFLPPWRQTPFLPLIILYFLSFSHFPSFLLFRWRRFSAINDQLLLRVFVCQQPHTVTTLKIFC
ncbi:unnamed protein product [Meloidogyne enterolobii]|uniref:Uncharacterized protein n=1 Tax=Meloidogyne enterolobii TaxID=390850 RepID=A0ACB1A1Z2_MELEN